VTPGNQLTTEQYAARVKAMMDSTENKMENEHVNLSAEDPNLSDIDEALIKLVELRLILAEEKGDKTAAEIACRPNSPASATATGTATAACTTAVAAA
jgi:hypothetical protein